MKKWFRFALWGILLFTCLILLVIIYSVFRFSSVQAGYAAQIACSGVFVSERELDEIIREDIQDPIGLKDWITFEVDFENRRVTAQIPAVTNRTSLYREGLGCTLLSQGVTVQDLLNQPLPDSYPIPIPSDRVLNRPESIPEGLNNTELESALEFAFSEPDPQRPFLTRAVIIAYDGKIIAERYRSGIEPDTPLLGWSMTKSVVNSLVGILVRIGRISIYERAAVREWQNDDDPRKRITLDQLLRQSSGLSFGELYFVPWSDVNLMLWKRADTGAYAASQNLDHPPDSHWQYSSGTTNIISRLIKETLADPVEYFEFPRESLFRPLGMSTALIEPDASGTFIGSSLMFASAQDWARFGLLYLDNGIWDGNQILPEGWVEYSTTPTPHAPSGIYGAHFWLNAGEKGNPQNRRFPDLPRDLYFASGFQGQFVVVIPSRKLVIVRLGMSNYGPWPVEEFVSRVLTALPETDG